MFWFVVSCLGFYMVALFFLSYRVIRLEMYLKEVIQDDELAESYD